MSGPFAEQQARETGGPVDLSASSSFRLGPLEVRPSTREVRDGDGAPHLVEPRVMKVLVVLAQADGAVVSRDALVARCWDGRIVGDDAINRAVAKARQIAEFAPSAAFAIEAIARVGYRLLKAESADADPAPMAAHQDPSVRPPKSIAPPAARRRLAPSRRLGLAIMAMGALVLLAIAAGGALYRTRSRPPPAPAGGPPTIAVLGFQADGQALPARALAASLPTRVADALSQYDVTVMATPAGAPMSAGRSDFVVSGRVEEKDQALAVTAELIETRDNILVYTFDASDGRGAQGDLAREIANHVALSLDPTKFADDLYGKLTAMDYTLIARGNDAIDRWDMDYALDQARRLALRHPGDGDLWASTAITAMFDAEQQSPAEKPRLLQLVRQSIARAGRLSPDSALLCIARAFLTNGPMGLARQEQLLRTALRLNPRQHVAYNALGELMLAVGRTREGESLIERSIQLDPMSGVVVGQGLQDLVMGGAATEASDLLRREAQVWPGDDRTSTSRYFIAHYLGDDPRRMAGFDLANPDLLHELRVPQARAATLARALRTRDAREVSQLVAGCFADYGHSVGQVEDVDCLMSMTRLGRLDDAFRFAAIAYPDYRTLYPADSNDWISKPPRELGTAWLFSPVLAPLRGDPRFWDVAVRTGLVDYWRGTGAWPDFCDGQLSRCRQFSAAAARADPARAHTGG